MPVYIYVVAALAAFDGLARIALIGETRRYTTLGAVLGVILSAAWCYWLLFVAGPALS